MQYFGILRRQVLSAIAITMLVGTWAGAAFGFEEAPALKAEVEAGTLPPLAERLPAHPLVLTPLESVGSFGGTLRQATYVGSDSQIESTIGYTRLVRWNPEWTGVVPDVAESYEINADATEYTFNLREGMRW